MGKNCKSYIPSSHHHPTYIHAIWILTHMGNYYLFGTYVHIWPDFHPAIFNMCLNVLITFQQLYKAYHLIQF